MSLIIPDVEALSIFLFLKKEWVNLTSSYYLLEKICLFWSFWAIPQLRIFFEGRCPLQPWVVVNVKWPLTVGLKPLLLETTTRRQHFYICNSGFLGNKSVLEILLVGCKLEWNVPGQILQSLCLLNSCLFFKFNFYILSEQMLLKCCAFSRCTESGLSYLCICLLMFGSFPM